MTIIFSILLTLLTSSTDVSTSTRTSGEKAIRTQDPIAAQIIVDELQN
jgi:hypothetical protein